MNARLMAYAALAAVLAGCPTTVDPDKVRQYPCDRQLGPDKQQCPGGWRCGLEGYCHDPDAGAPYECRVETDCEREWHCGPQNLCYDRLDAGAVVCRLDAGVEDCAPSWRCGLNERCHDRDAGAPYACTQQTDCEREWHCGVQGVCYDRAGAGALGCRRDAGLDDCAPTWRCGLENLCHDRDAGAPYQCLTDSDCELTWRCGPNGVCVDSLAEALRPATSALALQLVNPTVNGLPEQFAVGQARSSYAATGQGGQTHAYVTDAGLTLLSLFPTGFMPNGEVPPIHALVARRPLLGGPAMALAAVDDRAFVLDSLGVWQFRTGLDGGGSTSRLPFPAGSYGTVLRTTDEDPESYSAFCAPIGATGAAPLVMTFSGNHYALFDTGADSTTGLLTMPADAGIYDLAGVWGRTDSCTASIAASTSAGIFFASRGDAGFVGTSSSVPSWVPINVGPVLHPNCPGFMPDAGYVALRVYSDRATTLRLAVQVAPRLAFDAGSTLMVMEEDPTPSAADPAACYSVGAPSDLVCEACYPGETLEDFRLVGPYKVESLCRGRADGGETEYVVDFSNCSIDDTTVNLRKLAGSTVVPMRSSSVAQGFVDGFGRAWQPNLTLTSYLSPYLSPTLDVAPSVVAGTSATALYARSGLVQPGGGPEQFANVSGYRYAPGAGLFPADNSDLPLAYTLCATVRGRPWAVVPDNPYSSQALKVVDMTHGISTNENAGLSVIASLSDSRDIAQSMICGTEASPPFHATVARTRDGGTELLVTGLDALWAGDVSLAALDAGPALLDIKVVPLPRTRISSMTAVLPVTGVGTELISGYILVQQRLFRFQAETQIRWNFNEVALPPGEPVAVWADGSFGRVGYRDGTVYSLPSRVQIGAALTQSASSVQEYADLCGHAFALSSQGLFRLSTNPNGGVVGSWQKVDLSGALPPLSFRQGFAGARLFNQGGELLLFTAEGVGVSVKDSSCPP
jgi:hypothetical protein